MRVCNLGETRNRRIPGRLGQVGGPYVPAPTTTQREAAFRIIDENGFHVVNEGKRFPFTVSSIRKTDGTLLPIQAIQGVALSDEDSVVRVRFQVPLEYVDSYDSPVDAVLSLSGTNGVTYPIFQNRQLRFTIPPASQFPLDLQAVWAGVVKANEAAAAAKYEADEAAAYQQMLKDYQNGLASEAQAAAAAEKARQAAADAAAKKKAADEAQAAAEAAAAVAAGETAARNKKIMWAIGGVAAIGLISLLAFGSGK